MASYPYQLQPYAGVQSRYRCPSCNHRSKTFTRYIEVATGSHLAPHVGICNRADKCGYHLTPRQYLASVGNYHVHTQIRHPLKPKAQQPLAVYYIHPDYVNDSFSNYAYNNFYQYLIKRFGLDVAAGLAQAYRIGTSSHWHGATVFWQLDTEGHVRTGKIMLYDKSTGRRVKQPFNHINWAHSLILKQMAKAGEHDTGFVLNQCLFGEHLLIAAPYKPVAIVESEKTAIIASALMPAFVWLAGGSLEGLTPKKCHVLHGRKVILFPDVNAFAKWQAKAFELQRAIPGTLFKVSKELELLASPAERKRGIDIGDVNFV